MSNIPLLRVADIKTVWKAELEGTLSLIACNIEDTSFSNPKSSNLKCSKCSK